MKKKKATTRKRRREDPGLLSRMTALEERMGRMEADYRRRDRHFARLVAPIVGMSNQLDRIQRDLRVHSFALDSWLKQNDPHSRGIAEFEAVVDAEQAMTKRLQGETS